MRHAKPCLRQELTVFPTPIAPFPLIFQIKVINRVEEDYTRERKGDVTKVFSNPDPVVHPFERAREYTRALNATKLDKVAHLPPPSVL